MKGNCLLESRKLFHAKEYAILTFAILISIGLLYLLGKGSHKRLCWIIILITVFISFQYIGLKPFLFSYIILMWLPMPGVISFSATDLFFLIVPIIFHLMLSVVNNQRIKIFNIPITIFILIFCSIVPYILGTKLQGVKVSDLFLCIFIPVLVMVTVREVADNYETIWNVLRLLSVVVLIISFLPLILPQGAGAEYIDKSGWRLGWERYYYIPYIGQISLTATGLGTALGRTPPILLAYILSRSKKVPIFEVIVLCLSVGLLLLSGTRAGWAGTIVGSIIVLSYFVIKEKRKNFLGLLIIVLFGSIILYFMKFAVSQTILERLTSQKLDLTFNNRLDKWIVGFHYALSNPLGIGYTYYLVSWRGALTNPHNLFIDIAFGAGLAGLVAFFVYLFSRCMLLLKFVLTQKGELGALSIGILSFLISSILTGMANDDIAMKWLYLMWWIGFGCIESLRRLIRIRNDNALTNNYLT